MTNRANVVRWDIHPNGILMRMWIDDETGRHLTTAELNLGTEYLAGVMRQVEDDVARRAQSALFDL
jgi:hypothetical protein